MINKQYAFWKYDLFPFVLGGEVTRLVRCNGTDKVEVKRYGKGYWIAPTKIVDLSVGLKIQEKLDALTAERTQTLKTVNGLFNLKLNCINQGTI